MTLAFNWSSKSTVAGVFTGTTMNIGSTNINGSNGTFTAGDLLIAVICISTSTAATDPGTVTWPGGWTPVVNDFDTEPHSVFGDFNYRYSLAWKIAGASETGSYAVSWTNTPRGASWVLFNYGGANGATPIDASANHDGTTATTTTMVAPSISPAGAADIELIIGMYAQGQGPYTTPAGFTLRAAIGATSSGTPDFIAYDNQLSASGATGTTTIVSTSAGAFSAISIAISPASGGGDTFANAQVIIFM